MNINFRKITDSFNFLLETILNNFAASFFEKGFNCKDNTIYIYK